jgi:hypothetical protein
MTTTDKLLTGELIDRRWSTIKAAKEWLRRRGIKGDLRETLGCDLVNTKDGTRLDPMTEDAVAIFDAWANAKDEAVANGDDAALADAVEAAIEDPAPAVPEAPAQPVLPLPDDGQKTAIYSFALPLTAIGAYDVAKLLAKRTGVSVSYAPEGGQTVTIDAPAGGTGSGGLRTGGRLTAPGASDQIFIDLTTRDGGATTKEIADATGWKNPAPIQECQRIGARWGYDYRVDKSVRPCTYHLTKRDAAE